MKTFYLILFILLNSFSLFSDANEEQENYLDFSLEELSKIKITTAGKKLESVTDIPASVVIITKQDIMKYGFQSLEEILEHVTGLYMIDDYYWLGSVNYGMRGFFTNEPFNNYYLMVNDVNQMEDYSKGAPLTKVNVPVESIHRIEVVRGPMSVIYGSGAFLGAINIITNQNPKSYVSVSAGSQNYKKVFGQINKISENLKFALSASYLENEGLDVPYTDLTSNPVQKNGKTLLENYGVKNDATTKGQLSEKRTYIGGNLMFSNFTFDVSFTTNKNGMFDGQPALGDGNYFINNSFIMFGQYEKNHNDQLSSKFKITYSSYTDYIRYNHDYLNSNKGSNQISSFWETEANLLYTPISNLEILGGLNLRVTDRYQWGGDYVWGPNFKDFITVIESPLINSAAFLQATYKPHKNLSIVGGIRFEKSEPYTLVRYNDYDTSALRRTYNYDFNKLYLIPRLGIIYKINENNYLKALYGEAIKQPSLASIQPYVLHPEWLPLKPSEIKTFELNYINNFTSILSSNISLFYNKLNNLIVRRDVNMQDGTIMLQSTNDGMMDSYGIEVNFIHNPISSLIIDISGSYQISNDNTIGKDTIDLAYSPNFLGYLKMSYKVLDNITIALTYRYVDQMYAYFDNTSEGSGRIGNSSPSYSIFDSNILIENIFNDFQLSFKVKNLLNTEIRYPTTYANAVWDKGTVGYGRVFYLNIGYKLNI